MGRGAEHWQAALHNYPFLQPMFHASPNSLPEPASGVIGF
jgi:hypothetical protein